MKPRLVCLVLALTPLLSIGGVNPKNGNFYITYQDVSLSGKDHSLDFTRTYNSKSSHHGWTGFGWGTSYETYLVVLPDGSALVHENGNGQQTFYRTADVDEVKRGARQLAQDVVTIRKDAPETVEQLYAQLLSNEEQRATLVEQHQLRYSLMPGRVIADARCPGSYVQATESAYRRRGCDGELDVFDRTGRLLSRELPDGYRFDVTYAQEQASQVLDSEGHRIEFQWGANGQLSAVKSGNETTVVYEHNAKGDLVLSSDEGGNRYRYSYDANHNLTEIRYIDDTTQQISYVSPSSAMVSSIVDREGKRTQYEYRTDPGDAQHYWTRITVVDGDGRTASREFEFDGQLTETGVQQMQSIASHANGRDGRTRLDDKGRPIERTDSNGVTHQFAYDERCNKVSAITSSEQTASFVYNAQCELARLQTQDGLRIDIAYDKRGKIARMTERQLKERSSRKTLVFVNNEQGRPIRISWLGHGTMRVSYEANGEVREVKSTKGARMALAITGLFQNLLRVVKQADISYD